MLKLINIKKAYFGKTVLAEVNFDAKNGMLTALIGPNGAGKSTLFNIISGEIKQDDGVVMLNDEPISSLTPEKRAAKIAILRQDPKVSTAPSLTVVENFSLALQKNKRASLRKALSLENRQQILAHLTSLNLDAGLLDQEMGSLSGGQRQMLAFAMATIHRPALLLLDEPTAALDEKTTAQLMELVKRFIAEWDIPTVMICHDKELVKEFADICFELKNGVIFERTF